MYAERMLSMPKALTMIGMGVAALFILVFGLDLGLAFPFKRASVFFDVSMLICAGILGYLSYMTYREQV